MHLKMIFERDGLKNIFIMNNSDGQPRVTNAKRLLETLIPTCQSSSKNYHDNRVFVLFVIISLMFNITSITSH